MALPLSGPYRNSTLPSSMWYIPIQRPTGSRPKKDAGAAHCISVRRIMFSYAWLKPLPKTSVVLSMDMKAFRCSLWMKSCSWSASWRVRVEEMM